jgi:hypothetical protein
MHSAYGHLTIGSAPAAEMPKTQRSSDSRILGFSGFRILGYLGAIRSFVFSYLDVDLDLDDVVAYGMVDRASRGRLQRMQWVYVCMYVCV